MTARRQRERVDRHETARSAEVDRVLAEARALQAEADAGWPNGYEYAAVLARAERIVRRLSIEVALAPPLTRETIARIYVAEVSRI